MEASLLGNPSTESSNAAVPSTSSSTFTTTTTATTSTDDDSRHTHLAIPASQIPKPTASMSPPSLPHSSPPTDALNKVAKQLLARLHEDNADSDSPSPRLRSSRLFNKLTGKDYLPTPRKEIKKPLQLLDLPLDILKDIVKEVTHTNDLTSLALCHSALHRLAIPHIYSRFDIVWPDSITHAEPRSGVDALTYGLATLVMAEEIFGESPSQRREEAVRNKGNRFSVSGRGVATETAIRRRRGNHYAQFTKKFSLGNGPVDWVQEYLITKEGGKMLGTLVALALARMRALETFIWDMPTGILRDVWLALASLGERDDGRSCRLEKVWVRWHDNSSIDPTDQIPRPPPLVLSQLPPVAGMAAAHLRPPHPTSLDRVEHPSFSVLPALKSLSVLDIDELAYLDEMAVLIGRSIDKLRELRVGLARHALGQKWVTVWEGDQVTQVDPVYPTAGSVTIGEKRLGGVLGVLTGFVCDAKKPKFALPDRTRRKNSRNLASATSAGDAEAEDGAGASQAVQDPALTTALPLSPPGAEEPSAVDEESTGTSPTGVTSQDFAFNALLGIPPPTDSEQPPRLAHKLKLETLELERVPISVPVLQLALDWTHLTSLTLLHCPNHEQLWKTLRRQYAPTPKSPTYPHPRRTPNNTPRKGKATATSNPSCPPSDLIFPLRLKKVHTNTVSAALITFLKETLAPNSLETLFLQETRSYASAVSIEAIHKGPLRRHRGSLTRLLIDSSTEKDVPPGIGGQAAPPSTSSRYRRWLLNREVLSFVMSGKMPALRELGVCIEYRDWHFFLQHLPRVKGLRSLYLPVVADYGNGTHTGLQGTGAASLDARELALQVVDIVTLRGECEVCYVGIEGKCFEILERKRGAGDSDGAPMALDGSSGQGHGMEEEDEEDDEDGEMDGEEETESDDEVEEDEHDDDDDEDLDDDDDDDASEVESEDAEGKEDGLGRLRLREILFYDDKVAVFKARHGRL
ncbi:unnamed protein product [Zymoseptoria tritici ST99CH_3D1]|nr:unnamed protein product [Zymoseptoria tritici ST99CH_3D1]